MDVKMILDVLIGFLYLQLHFAVLAGTTVFLSKKVKLPGELYRKMLHMVSVFSIMPIVIPTKHWISAVLICALFITEAYLGTKLTNIEKGVGMKQRSAGEQQRSMMLLYGTYMLLILIGWGLFNQKWIVVLSVLAWGVGDAAAALVGKKFGKHKLSGKYIEGTKSVEGTVAMFAVSFVSVFALYLRHSSMSTSWFVVLVCFWIAVLSALVELFSKHGLDTIACPTIALFGFSIVTMVAGKI
ncbi:Dolichol kinase [Lachnospiraceae bacterium C7]|nr:Dolichol kinase [Lachnospiraceae bacterium C7]